MNFPDRFVGAQILASSFPDDTGEQTPQMAQALAAYRTDPAAYPALVQAIQDSRLLVPVVAIVGEIEYDKAGLAHDKSSDMAAVLMTGGDGRLALLAFTGSEQLQAWNPQARPVAVPAAAAALSAVQEDAAALVIDIASEAGVVIEGQDLTAIAAGWRLVEVDGEFGWLRPEVTASDLGDPPSGA